MELASWTCKPRSALAADGGQRGGGLPGPDPSFETRVGATRPTTRR